MLPRLFMHADLFLGISQGKPYALEGENGRSFVTDQYVKLAHGKAVRDFPFVTFSNSPLTEVCFLPLKSQILQAN